MKQYLQNWNMQRVLRLVLGIVIVVQGVLTQQWALAALGSLFSLLPLLNIGCCGLGGCAVPKKIINNNKEEAVYEEVC